MTVTIIIIIIIIVVIFTSRFQLDTSKCSFCDLKLNLS
jgi:hypothetical protein